MHNKYDASFILLVLFFLKSSNKSKSLGGPTWKNLSNKNFFHVGPPRDFDLFNDFVKMKSDNIDEGEYILCTGLFEKFDKDLNYYKELFEKNLDKEMICTNPDLIVDRGNKRDLCAGSVAMVFEKMGGKVVYFGKPYPEVYNLSINNKGKKTLSVGDNLNTDIKGANLLNYDSLIISNGIHKNEIENKGIEETARSYETICNYIQSELKWWKWNYIIVLISKGIIKTQLF